MNNIKIYREKLNITQKEMAERLGITQQAYSRKERGERSFSIEEAIMLEDILKVPVKDLFN
ncbi:helix-turn-helix transcriptional regulator (plasmid) [Paraclostridium ghonii]|uniref:helix-turn-helix transcriptional regulator n=1 Tax=Paraclostridium ghonii TaxID=29358 RepID=UPI00202CBF7F|nr:helix-turn-helix transcriptional regulator [Paeniclostridium ghonii]MCM0166557.1 helix-turn-helix domain-containing protein [Paeniclostridium ghonii]